MSYGVALHVWGERACFTRPEMKVERVSYDVMTPSAARGILEAIHWKPAIRWVVDRIHVLKPVRFESIRRNEVGHRISEVSVARAMKARSTEGLALAVEDDRQQRAATVLKDVAYVIEAHFEMVPGRIGPEDSEGKHLDMFRRRATKGQCFHRPCLGVREFAADFALVEGDLPSPHPTLLEDPWRDRDLGLMLLDIDFANGRRPKFFRAHLRNGVVSVPRLDAPEVRG
ncbi:type I-C CRISPR-associated protein Cas5c [Microvirga thermotolerans]|uniref:pre-crRNA processing endonuclease n=1 Tax=Microvirga thermotolerans TaxID=2651334 RepID=A0A5P9JU06_9HYPH|nr:type I-C CRISPR-associated protein Cas5c [Microvirga thermotolerans]QFU15601.1 type I-C CRISPR-associated protein Cas5 [Microvirga thermotolerans]